MISESSRELGKITYSDMTIYVYAVEPTALTDPGSHEVIHANDQAAYVLFNDHTLRRLANEMLMTGTEPRVFERYLMEIANEAALTHFGVSG